MSDTTKPMIDVTRRSGMVQVADPSAGWPALTGSPAQVEWANEIRRHHFAEFSKIMPTKPVGRPKLLDLARRFAAMLELQTSARWWIESRDLDWASLVGGPQGSDYLMDAIFEQGTNQGGEATP